MVWIAILFAIILIALVFVILDKSFEVGPCYEDVLPYAIAALLLEGVVFLYYHLIPWVLSWNTNIVVKISFIAMPVIVILGVVFFVISRITHKDKWLERALLTAPIAITNAIICMVFAWMTSIVWQIAILSIVGLACVVAIYEIHKDSKPFAVVYGDHGECVEYYPSRRAYRKAKKNESSNRDWLWGGTAV